MSKENLSLGFPTKSDTNQAVQSPKMARGLESQIYEVEELYYLCSKNKGADKLHTYHAAGLRLSFCVQVFSRHGSNNVFMACKLMNFNQISKYML